ncbi:hypothetical protein [Bacillus sp. T33-2]|uniref:hypothetical protein n=1 Tax=Bacillus sp. T33-2 TaxID=2054168 RepID=UPI000C75D794|nr:hypothetical protein [Bacillus sp. T33-2]PLR99561.1 hypothetical protein CVD19_00425 [Bacillus sp. T33-2]
MENQTLELLKKLLCAATKLDYAYLEAIQNGGKSSFSGEQYDEINDILAEADEFLNKWGRKNGTKNNCN